MFWIQLTASLEIRVSGHPAITPAGSLLPPQMLLDPSTRFGVLAVGLARRVAVEPCLGLEHRETGSERRSQPFRLQPPSPAPAAEVRLPCVAESAPLWVVACAEPRDHHDSIAAAWSLAKVGRWSEHPPSLDQSRVRQDGSLVPPHAVSKHCANRQGLARITHDEPRLERRGATSCDARAARAR